MSAADTNDSDSWNVTAEGEFSTTTASGMYEESLFDPVQHEGENGESVLKWVLIGLAIALLFFGIVSLVVVYGCGNSRVMPAAAPVPNAVLFKDPRPGKKKDVGIIGFYFPGHEEAWDAICGAAFLGNFYDLGTAGLQLEAPIEPGIAKSFCNAEAAFQALKFWGRANEFEFVSGNQAFKKKRQLAGMEDFSYGQFGSNWAGMMAVLRAKFLQGSTMAAALASTCDAYLLEHNSVMGRDAIWSDNFDGEGTNWLGLQLMLIRDELSRKQEWTDHIQSLIDLKSGRALQEEAAIEWQQIVRNARNALVGVVEEKERKERLRRQEEERKRRDKLEKEQREQQAKLEKWQKKQQERLAKEEQKRLKMLASKGIQVQPLTKPSASCLSPGCSKPTWNGQPNGYCSLDCKEDGPAPSPQPAALAASTARAAAWSKCLQLTDGSVPGPQPAALAASTAPAAAWSECLQPTDGPARGPQPAALAASTAPAAAWPECLQPTSSGTAGAGQPEPQEGGCSAAVVAVAHF